MNLGDEALNAQLNDARANYSLTMDANGAFGFRLNRVPVDDLSVMMTFLAVQGDVNTALQAQGRSIMAEDDSALAGQGTASAPLGDDLKSRIARTARHIDSLVTVTRKYRTEGPQSTGVGDRDSIFIETTGRVAVTVLSVNPQYLARVGPDEFEQVFNQCLGQALEQQ